MRMPAMEMRLPGLAWKILLIRSTHSRDRCRLLGKLYFTPMMRCTPDKTGIGVPWHAVHSYTNQILHLRNGGKVY